MSTANPSQYRAFRDVRAKTRNVVDYHRDESLPGKPLHLLIPGGLIALVSLAIIVYVIYAVWFDESMAQATGIPLLWIMGPLYIGGVYLFSYGYELYNVPKALRLTAILVFITLAAVVIIAVLAVILGGGGKSSSHSDSSSSSGSSHSSSSGSTSVEAIPSRSSSYGGGGGAVFAPLSLNLGGPTHTVTERVIEKETAPQPPPPITCPYCGRSYVPRETHFVCPSCGAATPAELLQDDGAAGTGRASAA